MIEVTMHNPGNWGTEEIHKQWPSVPSNYITWTQEHRDVCIWVDDWVDDWGGVQEKRYKYNIAVLIEPAEPSTLYGNNYQFVRENLDCFDLVFVTYPEYAATVKNPEKVVYFPGGGRSYVHQHDWSIYPKTKNITSIVSSKRELFGHCLRHLIKDTLQKVNPSAVDYNNPPITEKILGTKDYRFDLAIENCDYAAFSEKLTDPMLVGCVPIYWTGLDTNYLDMFDKSGIVIFKDHVELLAMIQSNFFTEELYNSKIEAIKYNFEVAQRYTSLGDILWNAGLNNFFKNNIK